METADATNEPNSWTVDQVKQWAQSTFPFGGALAGAIVENDVDGSILLTHLTDDTLKNDLQIKSLGQRVKIMDKIMELRRRELDLECDKIQNRRISMPLQMTHMRTPFRDDQSDRRNTISFGLEVSRRQLSDLSISPFPPMATVEYSLKSSGKGVTMNDVTGTPNSICSKFKAERHQHSPLTPQTPTNLWKNIENPFSVGSPMLLDLPDLPDEEVQEHEDQADSTGHEFGNARGTMDTAIFSLKVRSDSYQIREKSVKRRKLNPQYFRPAELRAADIMFTPEGEELDQSNISIDHPSHPTGERLYVQGLMRKFLQNPDIIEFPHNNETQRTVWTLHSEKYVKKHEKHTALVFDSTSDGCNVFRASVGTLGTPEQSVRQDRKSKDITQRFQWDGENAIDGGDEWSYLEKWKYMENDELLPVFNESDSDEGAYDESTLREMEIEERQKNGEQEVMAKPLYIDQVRQVVDEELTRFEELWREKELPKWMAKAYRVYKQYHRRKSKKSKTARCRGELDLVKKRIVELKGEYEEIEWKSVKELKRMCTNLQESVNALQELQWHIDLLTGPRPEKPKKAPKPEDEKAGDEAHNEVEDGLVNDEAAQFGEADEDENIEDEDEDMEDDMEDDMKGFIVDDDDMDVVLPEEGSGFGDLAVLDDDEGDVDIEGIDSEEADKILTPSRRKRKALRIEVTDEAESQSDTKDSEEPDVDSEDDEKAKEPELPELPTPLTQNVDTEPFNGDFATHAKAASKYSLRSKRNATDTLPTPPQESDEGIYSNANVQMKEERPQSAATTISNLPDSVEYDSDIFCSFGDKEVSEFCQCTERSAAVAKDYLLKADGDTSRAISFYFEDLANDRISDTSKLKRKKIKKSRKEKEVVRLDDSDDDADVDGRNAEDITTFMKPPLSKVLPRDGTLQAVKVVVSSLRPQVLHENMNIIAGLIAHGQMNPTEQFLVGETLENCSAFWKIYLAYTQDLFGQPRTERLAVWCIQRIGHPQRFAKFYDRLCSYLRTESHDHFKSTQDPMPESSQASGPPSSPVDPKDKEKREKKDKRKKPTKTKTFKPVTKSNEQKLQEAELKRIADRERDQQKKGRLTTTTADGGVIINAGKKLSEYAVCLHPDLAKVMKPHQIEGVQFMWLQTVMMTKGRGCLLAHTMGLGKTLQVIAFLITLASLPPEAYSTLDMPEHLNSKKLNRDFKRFMVVVPPSIVVNWANEFKKWTPKKCKDALGRIYLVNETSPYERMTTIRRWYCRGGVLLIGYSQFRALAGRGSKRFSHEEQISIREWLLNPGADLVVADEAHMIKNEKSQIGGLLKQIRTGSRIATTGSPLSNNLKEYWAMMNWIHQGFLGTLKGFTGNYIEPIRGGLYAESTDAERKESQKRLLKLKGVLKGKIHRMDISVIQSDLPCKTEFVIHVPLSPLQRKLYEGLLNCGFEGHHQLFKWINILRLVCNHPYILLNHIREQAKKEAEQQQQEPRKPSGRSKAKKPATTEETESEAPSRGSPDAPDAEDNEEIPPVSELQWATDIFDQMGDERPTLMFTEHGNKSRIVKTIVHEAVKLKDNVLIFVHSIPTLKFLNSVLTHKKHRIYILTGETQMEQRQDDIDRFNKEAGAIYLISSKAGSLGLNITSANRVILYDLAWNPVHDQQAVGRAYRLGQKKHVFVYRLGTYGTYEDIFFEENIFKLNLSKRVIDKHNPGRFGTSRNGDKQKYFEPPKEESEAVEIDREVFDGKDIVLDKLLELSDEDKGPKIVELELSDTFHKDEEETYLTAEDTRAANEEAEKEKKLREEGLYVESKYAWGTQSQVQREIAMDLFPEEYAPSVA